MTNSTQDFNNDSIKNWYEIGYNDGWQKGFIDGDCENGYYQEVDNCPNEEYRRGYEVRYEAGYAEGDPNK